MRRLAKALASVAALTIAGCEAPPPDAYTPEPQQSNIVSYGADERGISRVATFDAQVLVLSRKVYSGLISDEFAEFSPIDLAVAWGEGAQAAVHGQLRIRQRNRFYYWSADSEAWSDPRVRRFGRHSANWHIVPGDKQVRRTIGRLARGDVVELRGFLIDIELPNGNRYRTSRTRTDTGGGACEIFLVEEVRLVGG